MCVFLGVYVCVLLVLLDAGEQRLQPPCCAFTMSVQKGYDLETRRKDMRQKLERNHHMGNRSLGGGRRVHACACTLTHLAGGEGRSL